MSACFSIKINAYVCVALIGGATGISIARLWHHSKIVQKAKFYHCENLIKDEQTRGKILDDLSQYDNSLVAKLFNQPPYKLRDVFHSIGNEDGSGELANIIPREFARWNNYIMSDAQ